MKISASITDFPMLSRLETFFKEFSKAGVDGIELVLGIKSRLHLQHIKYLSQKYRLPITSVHQPAWSGLGMYFDERFLLYVQELGVNRIVFHPLAFQSFESKNMQRYFSHLSRLQQQYNVHIMLENMPNDFMYHKLFLPPHTTVQQHLAMISEFAETYGLSITYDVSHAELTKPQETQVFQKLLPKIANIHVSSFVKGHHHLPLNRGILDVTGFLSFLKKKKYQGLMTLEVYYPRLTLMRNVYDFSAVADSVRVFREILDKSS
ncbi:MAG TPA: sugar phosphate isomerase/epimerase [Patescibacteria group bacterium]|nr:sugar phosphate isomerase/epimerase [Patescibacteria group bacterium]